MSDNISVIVFDLGNVLIPFDYTPMIERFNKIESGLGDKFFNFYNTNYHYHRDFEGGALSEEKFTEAMLNALDNKVDKASFYRIYSEIFTVNEEMAAFLPKLKKNYTLCLLSNTNPVHREYGYKQYEFLNTFDKLFLSYEMNALKPDEKIYRLVEEYTKRPSEEHVFIDDTITNVDGAVKAGWKGIHFTNYENLLEEFKKRGIKY